ncbi:MAG: serine/threonine protein phosphatase [Clostridia bacterium]|nr:serine/threonine protein phosphatase [Clostridia bacterium]
MAKFILKWRYIKSGTKGHGVNLVKYVATREGVEFCEEAWKSEPATKEQMNLIRKLVKDFPETVKSFEYEDYKKQPTKYSASELITRTIEENLDRIGKKENYVEYIAMRPRVEKDGAHGLFSAESGIDLEKVTREVAEHKGAVWTTVLSLRRENAVRLGYDNAKEWKRLLCSKEEELARAMGISCEDIKWYAAFHNEGHHPHVHLISYSTGKEPYMTQRKLQELKSSFANEIFKQDLYHVFVEQTKQRDELRALGRDKAEELITKIQNGDYQNETVELMLKALVDELKDYAGKKVYGYLPKKAKNLVNGIVDELAKDERIAELYELWYKEKDKIVKTYQDGKAYRLPLSRNEEFKTIRNAVVKEAMKILRTEQDPLWQEKKKMWELYKEAKDLLDKNSMEYNPKRSLELLIESARFGNTVAKYLIGKMYLRGEGTKRNVEEGKRWLTEAQADGNEYAKQMLEWRNYQQWTATRSAFRLFHYLGRLLQDGLEKGKSGRGQTESKLRRAIDEKKRAHGIKQE